MKLSIINKDKLLSLRNCKDVSLNDTDINDDTVIRVFIDHAIVMTITGRELDTIGIRV